MVGWAQPTMRGSVRQRGFHSSTVARAEALSTNHRAFNSVYLAHSGGTWSSGRSR